MPLPRFDFAPHEWPPLAQGEREGLADAVFDVVWDWEVVQVMARLVQRDTHQLIFFRRVGEEKTTRVVSGNGIILPQHYSVNSYSEEKLRERLEETVFLAIKNSHSGRAFLIDTSSVGVDGLHWVYLHNDERRGQWIISSSFPDVMDRIFGKVDFLLSGNSSTFEEELNSPRSDARFALTWSLLSEEERYERASNFSNGTFEEMQDVVRVIALVENLNFNPTRPELTFGRGTGFYYYREGDCPSRQRLSQWTWYLSNHFAPAFDDSAQQHLCTQAYIRRPLVQIQLSPSTQHERLEAALFLRDWARDKIPPDELKLLLPKL